MSIWPRYRRTAFAPRAVTAALLAVLLAGAPTPASPQAEAACPEPASIIDNLEEPFAHVRYLADDALRGREVATDGARCAAEYLAAEFREIGLEPAGRDGSYFQTFPVRVGATVGRDNLLATPSRRYPAREAWMPFGFSASAEASGPMVYGAHGINRPDEETGDGTQVEVEGRILVVESGDPGSPTGRSVHADPHFKATVAAGRGAAGLLVLLPDDAGLPDPSREVRGPLEIPVAAVSGPAAGEIRRAARREARATLRAEVSPRTAQARNVVGLLPGSDPALRDEWVVLGAHYDHLGVGGEGSLAPDDFGTVHNGADDNASGTAAVVEAARRLSREGGTARSVLFVGFTGEEKGLWGSTYYVREPLHPLERTEAMLNLDMVGRLEDGPLTLFGTGTAEEWTDLLEGANRTLSDPLELAFVEDGSGPSDHSVFFARGLPVLHFFTNTHADYHRPGDDWQKIDRPGLERVTLLLAAVTRRLAGDRRIAAAQLTPVRPANPHAGAPSTEPGRPSDDTSRGYGPYLGTIPDMTPTSGGGVRLTGVRESSPAEEAGIRGGDVVVEFEGRTISDLYDYTYALRDQEPGDTVRIVVERDGRRVELGAVLGNRR